MNIHIDQELAEVLFNREVRRYIIGSELYTTNHLRSDTDILVVYESLEEDIEQGFNLNCSFQYKNTKDKTDYIFTTPRQFICNLYSGDSMINLECCLFYHPEIDIEDFRTYKILKGLNGFAKRDLKENKIFHAQRALLIMENLLDRRRTTINDIVSCFKNPISNQSILDTHRAMLREEINELLQEKKLTHYPLIDILDSKEQQLLDKLIHAANYGVQYDK